MWWTYSCVMVSGLKWTSKSSFNTEIFALDAAITAILKQSVEDVAIIRIHEAKK